MKKIFCLIGCVFSFINLLKAQSPTVQDCPCAIPICQPVYSELNAYSGTGNIPQEINNIISCLGQGEKNSVWYSFTVQSSGLLKFSITPNVLSDDYDWAVYNLSNANCSDIYANPSLEVACNYAGTPGVTGPNGLPGMQNGPPINVLQGQTYVINVSQFSVSPNGYTIDFSASTASILDQTPPTIDSVNTNFTCGQDSFQVTFSENIQCSSVDKNDFLLIDPTNDTLVIDSVYAVNCNSVCGYARTFIFYFNPAANYNGTYILSLINSITDVCGNAAPPTNFNLSISAYSYNNTTTNATCNGGNDGAINVTILSPGNFTYLWSNGQTTSSLSSLTAGTYTVTVTQTGVGCPEIISFTIAQPNPFSLSNTITGSPCSGSNGSIVINVDSGGVGPYTYLWNNGNTNSNIGSLAAGTYTVTVTDAQGCTTLANYTVPGINDVTAAFTYVDSLSCEGARVFLTNTSTGATTYSWFFDGVKDSLNAGPNATVFFAAGSNHTISLIAINGACSDTNAITYTLPELGAVSSITNIFTPNGDGINDCFAIGKTGEFTTCTTVEIHNRWGNKIWSTTATNKCWDGKDDKGNPVPEGTYFYILEFKDKKYTGHVMVVK